MGIRALRNVRVFGSTGIISSPGLKGLAVAGFSLAFGDLS